MKTMWDMLRKLGRHGEGDVPRDPVVSDALTRLDPAGADPSYWHRFHRTVMLSVRGELSRRRRVAGVTVSDVVVSWSRALVPAAMLAAVLASFFLIRAPAAPPVPVGLEEMLAEGITAPLFGEETEADAGVTFASERF